MMIKIEDNDINKIENILLPQGCHFSDDGKNMIRCMESKEVLACPGSGKTTLLMAKLYILSKSMPFKNNKGICVLSHTNVAIDEIKSKLGYSSKVILSYPNYVGTIQSFIDKYVVFPYLTHFTTGSIEVVDNKKYAECMWRKCKYIKDFKTLKFLVIARVKQSSYYENEEHFFEDLYLSNAGELYLSKSKIAGANSSSAIQYKNLKDLLKCDGIIKFDDTYRLGIEAIEKYGEELIKLLSKRFKYVFVDEYQDCDELQCKAINQLFNMQETIVQKIGDVDQAIYTGVKSEEIPWKVSDDALLIPGTNRYHQKIADELVKLRTNNEKIISFNNQFEIKPIIIVYDESKIKDVLRTFVTVIEKNNLPKLVPNGKYKVIGMIKNGKGITIGDYWDEYKKEDMGSNKLVVNDYVQLIIQYIIDGDLSSIEKCVRKMLCQICYIINRKEESSNKYFTVNSIKNYLYEYEGFDYKTEIIGITRLYECNSEGIKEYLINIIKKLGLDDKDMRLLYDFIHLEKNVVQMESKYVNKWVDDRKNIQVDFTTVYKVKGETHTATLYLETETNRSSDLKRIMPLFHGKEIKNKKEIHEKSRKVVYVGFSRPTHLLCVAMQNKTYSGNEKAFKNWRVIKL